MSGGWTMPVYFFRSEPGAAELRRLARRESGRVCQRVLLMANMREGVEHEEAARLAGLSGSTATGRRGDECAAQGTDCRWRRAGAGRCGGVSRGRRATNIERGV